MKVFADLGEETVHVQRYMIAHTSIHKTRKAKVKEKEKKKGKVKEKERKKPKAKEKEKRRKEKTSPAKANGLARMFMSTDGEKIKEVKAPKAKEREKEKVKAMVKAKREVANENNPHSAHPSARIGTRLLARLATAASLTTHQTAKTGRTDGANGIKNVVLGTSRV